MYTTTERVMDQTKKTETRWGRCCPHGGPAYALLFPRLRADLQIDSSRIRTFRSSAAPKKRVSHVGASQDSDTSNGPYGSDAVAGEMLLPVRSSKGTGANA